MPSVRKVMTRKMDPSMAEDIIIDSNLPWEQRVEESRLFGPYYPVPISSVEEKDSVINIEFDLPRIVGGKEKRRAATLRIRPREGDVHSVSLLAKGFGLLYNDYIGIDETALSKLRDMDCGRCAVPNTKTQRLAMILYATGDVIDFAGERVEIERPYPIIELITGGAYKELPEHEPDTRVPPDKKEPEDSIDIEKAEEEPTKREPTKTKEPGFDKNWLYPRAETPAILGIISENMHNFEKNNPELAEKDGSYKAKNLAVYAVTNKKLKEERVIEIIKNLEIPADNRDDAIKFLEGEGIKIEPITKKTPKKTGYSPTDEFLSKKLSNDEMAHIFGKSKGAISFSLSKGYLKGKTRRDVLERIGNMKRETEESKLKMYNRLFEEQDIHFGSTEEVYSAMPELKKN